MTTIEGQLAVLGGAATRPQGDTEVNFSMTSYRYQTIGLPLCKMIYMCVRGSRNNKTETYRQTDRQTEDQLAQRDSR
jgi:hypothetical protein